MSTSNELFLDAAYLIALAVSRDPHHERAIALRDELKLSPKRLVTTRAGALEIGNALAKARYRPAAVQMLRAFKSAIQMSRSCRSLKNSMRAPSSCTKIEATKSGE